MKKKIFYNAQEFPKIGVSTENGSNGDIPNMPNEFMQ